MARLGYERYGAQGGDWGPSVTTSLGQPDPEHVVGIHLNMPIAAPDPATLDDLTDRERAALADLRARRSEWDSGYSKQQSTRPQTLGYGLVDSPAGQCAWIVEKFWAWTDCDGDPENVLTRDELLDNVMLYWLPGTGASSARLYWESFRQVRGGSPAAVDPVDGADRLLDLPEGDLRARRAAGPSGASPTSATGTSSAKGGHFAAFEQPELFVDEVRAFFRLVR